MRNGELATPYGWVKRSVRPITSHAASDRDRLPFVRKSGSLRTTTSRNTARTHPRRYDNIVSAASRIARVLGPFSQGSRAGAVTATETSISLEYAATINGMIKRDRLSRNDARHKARKPFTGRAGPDGRPSRRRYPD